MGIQSVSGSFQLRRDTASNWEKKNPVLKDGEFITVITDSGTIRHKTGDGTKTYAQLPFEDESLYNALTQKADQSNKVSATLNADSWMNKTQTITIDGTKPEQKGIISLAENVTAEQYNAVADADISVSSQGEGAIVFACRNDVPQIDIPLSILLLG